MKLSWRDLLTTIFLAAAALVLVAKLRNYDWDFMSTWKSAIGAMAVIGGFMVVFDEADFTKLNYWSAVEGVLVLSGIGLMIAGLLVASKALFIILGANILAFWLISVTRHTFSHEPRVPQVPHTAI